MQKLSNQILDLSELEKLSTNLCEHISVGDIYLFQGELGAGKTTFIRLLINNLFVLNNLPKPSSITSPTFPILITYELNSSQIYHYDLYRVKSLKELEELDFFENLKNNITFIEWPEMLISLPLNKNHYLINLDMISETKRKINIWNTKIIIDFSRDKQEFKNFLTVYEILQKINISIPKIYEVNQKQYKIYMQDFGKNRFNKIYNKDNLYKLLKLAVENIIVIQNESNLNNLKNLKEYTFEDLKIELKEFVTYYTSTNKKSNFPTSKFYETWKSIFYSQNYNMKNFVHKDFEFVNLFFLENCESHLQCGIIDFQSAFKGFIGWDLISLLENPRINFTRDYNDKLIEYFYDKTSIIENFNTFLEQYYVLSLARQTRLLGRWSKLLCTNNDNKYLNYLKITKSRTIATLNNIKNYELRSMYEKYL